MRDVEGKAANEEVPIGGKILNTPLARWPNSLCTHCTLTKINLVSQNCDKNNFKWITFASTFRMSNDPVLLKN